MQIWQSKTRSGFPMVSPKREGTLHFGVGDEELILTIEEFQKVYPQMKRLRRKYGWMLAQAGRD